MQPFETVQPETRALYASLLARQTRESGPNGRKMGGEGLIERRS